MRILLRLERLLVIFLLYIDLFVILHCVSYLYCLAYILV